MMEKKHSLKDKAYNVIKDKIITCEYLPGDFLNEKLMAETLGVSRTPIRDALQRIEKEGLVKVIPKRGVMVSEITMKAISEVYQVRECVEPYVVQVSGYFFDEETLRNFKKRFEKLGMEDTFEDQKKYHELDDEFHRYLITASHNHFFEQTMEGVYIQNQRVRLLVGKAGYSANDARIEHITMIDALLAHDEEKAVALMAQHIKNGKGKAFQAFMNFTNT